MTAKSTAREGDGVADLSERRALRKALDALDTLSEAWAEEANIRGMCANIAKAADLPEAIYALVVQAWVEGAYAGRTSHQDHPALQAQQGAEPVAWQPIGNFGTSAETVLLYSPTQAADEDYPGHPYLISNRLYAKVHGADNGYTMWMPIRPPAAPATGAPR